jgi:hypothetical protein
MLKICYFENYHKIKNKNTCLAFIFSLKNCSISFPDDRSAGSVMECQSRARRRPRGGTAMFDDLVRHLDHWITEAGIGTPWTTHTERHWKVGKITLVKNDVTSLPNLIHALTTCVPFGNTIKSMKTVLFKYVRYH